MGRCLFALLVLALAFGCRLPADRDDLKPFDDKQAALPFKYSELYVRARSQANLALESFYADAWADLDAAARGLQQTAQMLPKAIDTPADEKISLELQADAGKLIQAADAKDVRAVNETLQRIQFNVRTLRPKEPMEK